MFRFVGGSGSGTSSITAKHVLNSVAAGMACITVGSACYCFTTMRSITRDVKQLAIDSTTLQDASLKCKANFKRLDELESKLTKL